jgi:HEAT repeat protein
MVSMARKVADVTERRREVALAGHAGDEGAVRSHLADDAAAVRATALGALARLGALTVDDVAGALDDDDPLVRRRACEEAGRQKLTGALDVLVRALTDDGEDSHVVETAAWALGELEDPAAVDALAAIATEHDEPLCRESAVAALGAIADEGGQPAILPATADNPAVRRRAVIALAPFDGPDVDAALRRALQDRDWQVRQAAEDLLAD